MNVRTHVILDGLQDPLHARELSARWMAAGFVNAVDVAGQAGWIEKSSGRKSEARSQESEESETRGKIDETDLVLTAGIARAFGIELRERVGTTITSANDLAALREQVTREYRGRFVQSLIFGIPALAVHYLGPRLASGGGQAAGSMAIPWLLEMVLVGWALWVAGLPILWQGVWSMIHLRPTADLLTTAIVMLAFVPSSLGVVSLLFGPEPWFGGPVFHIAIAAVMIATCQRWLMHRQIEKLSGRGNRMLQRSGVLFFGWLFAMLITMIFAGWEIGLSFGLLLPPLISSAGINRSTPGWSAALPVLAFAPFFLFGPQSLPAAAQAEALRFEIAVGFAVMMTVVMSVGWSRMERVKAAS